MFGVDPDRLAAFARHVEACGFEGMYVPEHVALYPGATFGGHPVPTTLPYGDPLELLLFAGRGDRAAAARHRGAAAAVPPPVVLAKRLATVDRLSKGRLRLLTVGLGSLPGEAAAMGVDFASRGRRADEAIDVLRLLMTGDEQGVSFAGEFFAFDSLCSFPQPAAPLPIHVGGSSAAAARRAGRRGDGWFPGGLLSPQERRAQLAIVRSAAEEADRDPSALQYTRWGSSTMTEETLERLREEGVTRVVVGGTEDELERFAGRFIGRASSG
ncbi:TIGR03619 family F420-dependent LLM class oxidoreductase [Dactylosporangium vinaceum]